MATSARSLNQEARITNNEKLVSALVASMSHDCAECLPVLACCCGSCTTSVKNVPVFVDTRGQYGQIVPNFGMVHTACIRDHGVLYMCTRLPLCDMCHARRKVDSIVIPQNFTREQAILEAVAEYAARAAELKAAVAMHKEEPDEIAMPAIEPSAKRFQTSEAPPKMFSMPGMTVTTPTASVQMSMPAPAPAPVPAMPFAGMKVVAAPAKIPYPIATQTAQTGKPLTIKAKFNSKCAALQACTVGLQIQAGDQVVWIKPIGVFHPECATKRPDPGFDEFH